MKRALSLLSIYLLVIVCSCTKNSDPAPSSSSLLGTWKEVSSSATGCTDSSQNFNSTCVDPSCRIMTIESNSIIQSFNVYYYTAQGDKLILTSGSATLTVTYKLDGNTLTIISQDTPANGGCTNTTVYTRTS